MAEEANNTAPVEANEAPKSETPTNTEPAQQPEQPTEQPQEKAPENTITLTEEQAKFLKSNGGWDKVFEKAKSSISNPQKPKEEEKPAEPQEQKVAEPVEQPAGTPQGYISPRDFYVKQYFKSLAKEGKYSAIAEDVESGNVLKEMAAFNIAPTDQDGNINDSMVRKFLDLKAQTVPAPSQSAETSSATPTVTYTEVGEEVSDRATANKILSEPGHPRHEDAVKFLRKEIFGDPNKKDKK